MLRVVSSSPSRGREGDGGGAIPTPNVVDRDEEANAIEDDSPVITGDVMVPSERGVVLCVSRSIPLYSRRVD